jgi:hypothetical protein
MDLPEVNLELVSIPAKSFDFDKWLHETAQAKAKLYGYPTSAAYDEIKRNRMQPVSAKNLTTYFPDVQVLMDKVLALERLNLTDEAKAKLKVEDIKIPEDTKIYLLKEKSSRTAR